MVMEIMPLLSGNDRARNDDYCLILFVYRPYLIDLESTHGTFLNGKRIEPGRFVQLLPKDIIKLGASTREYVFLVEDEIPPE